jgi:hypothetical protein
MTPAYELSGPASLAVAVRASCAIVDLHSGRVSRIRAADGPSKLAMNQAVTHLYVEGDMYCEEQAT